MGEEAAHRAKKIWGEILTWRTVIELPSRRTLAAMRRMSLMIPARVRVSPDVAATSITTAILRVKAVRVFPSTTGHVFCRASNAKGSL